MGGTRYFVLRKGGGCIFVTSLHFTTKKRPMKKLDSTFPAGKLALKGKLTCSLFRSFKSAVCKTMAGS